MEIYLGIMSVLLFCVGLYTIVISIANKIHFHCIEKKTSENLKKTGELISIIIPARNEEKNIGRLLESLTKQDYENFEVLVIDDDSSDRTWDIIKKYEKKDPRIHGYQSNKNIKLAKNGKINALLQVLDYAKGDYLYATDADTEHNSNALSYAYSVMKTMNLNIISGFPKEKCESYLGACNMAAMLLAVTFIPHFLSRFISIPALSVAIGQFIMMEKKSYEETGGYLAIKDEICDDMSICRLFVKKGKRYHFIPVASYVTCYMYEERKSAFYGIARSVSAVVPSSGLAFPIVLLLVVLLTQIALSPILFFIYPLWIEHTFFMCLWTIGSLSYFTSWMINALTHLLPPIVALSGPITLFEVCKMYLYGLSLKIRKKNFIWKGRNI